MPRRVIYYTLRKRIKYNCIIKKNIVEISVFIVITTIMLNINLVRSNNNFKHKLPLRLIIYDNYNCCFFIVAVFIYLFLFVIRAL